ncbi:hypothetical protein ACOSP7_012591 [Xanthoceras sorbifolium]
MKSRSFNHQKIVAEKDARQPELGLPNCSLAWARCAMTLAWATRSCAGHCCAGCGLSAYLSLPLLLSCLLYLLSLLLCDSLSVRISASALMPLLGSCMWKQYTATKVEI